jgi:tRNA (mo5U34)-methyltransferase
MRAARLRMTGHEAIVCALMSEESYRKFPHLRDIAKSFVDRRGFVEKARAFVECLGAPREAIDALGRDRWFHSFEFSDGTRIEGDKSLEVLKEEFDAILGAVSFEDRTVLDIGAWNGAFSVEAMRRGARRVLAVDFPTWVGPLRVWRGLERFLYVCKDAGYDIDCELIEASEIDQTIGSFDIVLFLGVYYHLPEPLSILPRLRRICREVLVLETHTELNDLTVPAMQYVPGESYRDWTNWWHPNRLCVDALLRNAGFGEVSGKIHPTAELRYIAYARP